MRHAGIRSNHTGKVLKIMTRMLRFLCAALAIAGSASSVPVRAETAAPPSDFPANLRWDLVPKWIK